MGMSRLPGLTSELVLERMIVLGGCLAAVNVWVTKWGPESQWSLKSELVLEMAMGRHRRRHDVWLRTTGGDQMCMHVFRVVDIQRRSTTDRAGRDETLKDGKVQDDV